MRTYYVYILRCADSSLYTGVTNNLDRRFEEHQNGDLDSYVSRRRPVELIWHKEFKYILDAIAFEKKLKGWSRRKKLALINGDFELLKRLAKKRFIQVILRYIAPLA